MTENGKRRKYRPPIDTVSSTLTAVLDVLGKPPLEAKQYSMLAQGQSKSDTHLFYAGDLSLLARRSVAVVGARAVSEEGAARARRLARELGAAGIVVVSGLAKGVDVNAHTAAVAAGGTTVAVIGTPLDIAYPAEHAALQEEIAARFLLISPFASGSRVFQSNFPKRNRVMAALTDGTVIVEASDSSGTLHQAVECERLGRWLFILRSVYENPRLDWPKRFENYSRFRVVDTTANIAEAVLNARD
jgi:DNA processing protein